MAKGIYKITNNRTGEVYVGQTNNLYLRERQHMENLASGTHHNRRISNSSSNFQNTLNIIFFFLSINIR